MAKEVVFNEDFFKKLTEVISDLISFFRRFWFWPAIFFLILLGLIFFQQIVLFFFQEYNKYL